MKTIAFVMPFHISESGGGAEVQAWLFSKKLAEMGYDVFYLSQSLNDKTDLQILDGVNIQWIKYHKYFEMLGAKNYIKELNKIRPNIIIQRMTNFLTGKLTGWSKKNNCDFFWICTDNDTPFKTGALRKYINKTIFSISPIYWLKWVIFLVNGIITDLSKNKGIRNCDIAFTQNNYQYQKLRQNFSKSSFRILSGHEEPKNLITVKERFSNKIILWSGNLGKHKRPNLFIKLAHINKENKGFKFILSGDKRGKKSILKLLDYKPANLSWVGKQPFEENLRLFDKATLLINTSYSEGYSNTYIQAWLRGIPVLTLGADPDNIIEKFNLGITSNNIFELNAKMNYLLSNFEQYNYYNNNCLTYSHKRHTIKIAVEDFIIKSGMGINGN